MPPTRTPLSDEDLLAILAAERRQSVGFDEDADLTAQRQTALNYFKGEMPDLPALPKRSKVVSSDVADAIETALPDLIEIFTGGDDVLSFNPQGPEDEKAAEQETDYVRHVVFQQNPGFLVLYSMIKDALLSKLGVVKWWWDAWDGERSEDFAGQGLDAVAMAAQGGAEIRKLRRDDDGAGDGAGAPVDLAMLASLPPTATFAFTAVRPGGRLCIAAVPPEDFTAARDARLNIGEATYCAVRMRPRVQELIAWGLDAEAVRELPAYGTRDDGAVSQARDTVSEQSNASGGSSAAADSQGDLRQVEVVEHYIRLADDDGALQVWRCITGAAETKLLLKEKASRIQYAVVAPYIQTHRLYGPSVADKLLEVQRIKTALMRMFLDSGFFALNQRMQVVESKASEHTLSDLMRNEPMVPVRVKGEGAVTPLMAGGLAFDAPAALEYFSTVGEQRTGIVRNAQGLNPDTLHETATGAVALMGAAQKRLRLIARVLAETGLKDLFVGVHATLREHATRADTVRLRGAWVEIDPTAWGERADMSCEVGLGAAGREHDIAAMQAILPVVERLVQSQGGLNGPLIGAQNLYALLLRLFEKLGFKGAERYLTDPASPPVGPDGPGQTPQPGAPGAGPPGGAGGGPPAAAPPIPPELVKAQAEAQLAQARLAGDIQLQRERLAAETETARLSAASTLTFQREKLQAELALQARQAEAELALRREELQAEAAMKAAQIANRIPTAPTLPAVQMGGDPG